MGLSRAGWAAPKSESGHHRLHHKQPPSSQLFSPNDAATLPQRQRSQPLSFSTGPPPKLKSCHNMLGPSPILGIISTLPLLFPIPRPLSNLDPGCIFSPARASTALIQRAFWPPGHLLLPLLSHQTCPSLVSLNTLGILSLQPHERHFFAWLTILLVPIEWSSQRADLRQRWVHFSTAEGTLERMWVWRLSTWHSGAQSGPASSELLPASTGAPRTTSEQQLVNTAETRSRPVFSLLGFVVL